MSLSPIFTVALFIPSSPLTSSKFIFSNSCPVRISATLLNAASITPPVTPNIAAAPVASPIGLSNSSSSSSTNSIFACFIILASSLVVITQSTSYIPLFCNSVLCLSNFFAIHGITDTTYILLGSIPIFSA